MKYLQVYTLRDGTKKTIPIIEGESLREELQRAGIKENQIFQMQMVERK
ncbi:hypothetical protein [Priestia megaterium]|nr:hypothetical protein [Priestia megaterium]